MTTITKRNLVDVVPARTPVSEESSSFWELEIRLGPVFPSSEKQQFYHLLAVLLESGLSLVDGLDVIIGQTKKANVKEIISNLEEDLKKGHSFAESMAHQGNTFSGFEIYSIGAGEQTGRMTEIVQRLAHFYEKKIKLHRKLIQALSYPIAVIIISFFVVGFMMAFVVPMFQDIFARFDAELPALTEFIISVSSFFQANWGFILLSLGIMGLGIWSLRNNQWLIKWSSHLIIRLPLIGKLLMKIHLARLCYMLSLLLTSKVNLDKALAIMKDLLTFYPFKTTFETIRQEVVDGKSLNEAFKQHSIYPDYLHQIIRIGEESATLGKMLGKLANRLEDESETGVGQLTQFLEPVLILFLGGMVAIILISMYLPMFKLTGSVG